MVYSKFPTSHSTVRTGPYTALQLYAKYELNDSGLVEILGPFFLRFH